MVGGGGCDRDPAPALCQLCQLLLRVVEVEVDDAAPAPAAAETTTARRMFALIVGPHWPMLLLLLLQVAVVVL